MAYKSVKASAPGKLMLLGEHAVLHGRLSIVCAVNQRMVVQLYSRNDDLLKIESSLGEYEAPIASLKDDKRFRFVLECIEEFPKQLESGLTITITSDFSSTVGLGSSAAVTAATMAALYKFCDIEIDYFALFDKCLKIIHAVQGTGSGADLAASVFGGILAYRANPREIMPLNKTYPITVVYSGAKTPTTQVIKIVDEKRAQFPDLFDQVYDTMDNSAIQAVDEIKHENWSAFGELLNINQGLMDAIGVNNEALSSIINAMRCEPDIMGAKISGSGLGDCVVGLGTVSKNFPYSDLGLHMSQNGVIVERI